MGQDNQERALGAIKAVFQRENVSQDIFCPTVRAFFGRLNDEGRRIMAPSGDLEEIAAAFAPDRCIIPPTYKGVSFNPLLTQYGERFDMLDFFAWGRRVQMAEPNFRFLVLDATKYWMVNAMGRAPVEKYSKDAAGQAVESLRSELEKNRLAPAINEASDMRNRYLRAIASLLPNGSCQVLSAGDLWYGNDAYQKSLQYAVDFVAENPREGEPFVFGKYAKYSRYNEEYQRWYTPLVLAEVKYLYDAYGISSKLGPTSETAFDSLICQMMNATMERQNSAYNVFWYTRPLERQIPYQDYVFFKDKPAEVERKLAENSQLAAWMGEIASAFVGEKLEGGKRIADAVNALREKINSLAENPPAVPSTPGDWWFLWPPGSCG